MRVLGNVQGCFRVYKTSRECKGMSKSYEKVLECKRMLDNIQECGGVYESDGEGTGVLGSVENA